MNDEAELLPDESRSHWNEPEPPKAEHHAAVLYRGKGPVIDEDFDFWHYTVDKQVMLRIEDEDRLIMAESREKLELMLEARYPTLPGCTIIDPYNGPLHKRVNRRGAEDEYRYNRRVRDGYSQYTKYSGWVVLNTPRLRAKDLDRDDLRDKLVQHKVLLLNPEDFEGLGGKERLMATGISPVPGCFGNMKVRWNPKAVKLRDWRKTVKEVQALHLTQFDGGVLSTIARCVAPKNWPGSMPFAGLLEETGCNGHPSLILTCIEFARRLKPGSKPWRTSNGYSGCTTIANGIEAAKPYIRYIIKHGVGDDHKKLARWLLREANALKIVIPPIAAIPPKPYARKPAAAKVMPVEAEFTEAVPNLRAA